MCSDLWRLHTQQMLPALLHHTWRMNTASLIVLNVGYMIRSRGSCFCRLDCQMIIRHVIWLEAEVDKPSACDTVWFRLLASVSETHFAEIPTLSLLSLIWRHSFVCRSEPYDFVLSPSFIYCAVCMCTCACLDCLVNAGFCFSLVFVAT